MYAGIPGAPLLIAVLAVLPGLLYWWSARRLLRQPDDPLLPERLLALRRRSGIVFGLAIPFVLAGGPSALFWALPLLIVARMLAAYPLRRALYGETWSVPQYLQFSIRTVVALGGFWFALAMLPAIAATAGRLDWVAGAALGGLLLLAHTRYTDLLLWLFNASPLDNERVLSRLGPMAEACGMPGARIAVADLRGGAIVNALAIPALGRPAVLFADTLLARLDEDEVVAIGAHELAHLEYYDARRLRHSTWTLLGLVAAAVAIAPIVRTSSLPAAGAAAAWALTVLAFLVLRAQQRQKHETESDRRAVALTGNPDALISGLIKAYAFNRFPRRLDRAFEREATHPSLAKRLRDIRAAAAREAATLETPLTMTCVDGTVVTLDKDRLHWTDPRGATHEVPYGELTELRIQDVPREAPRLVARGGPADWSFRVRAADVPALHDALDIVDARLAEPPLQEEWAGLARLLAAVGVFVAVISGFLAGALVLLAAGLRPRRYLIGAAAVAVLLGALVLLRDSADGAPLLLAAALIPLSVAVFVVAWRTTPGDLRTVDRLLLGALGAAAAVVTAALFVNGAHPIDVFLAARAMGTGCMLPGAFVAAVGFGVPRFRVAAGIAALWAAAVVVAGSSWAVRTFGSDPLLAEAPAFEVADVAREPFVEFTAAIAYAQVRLSPLGTRVALAHYLSDGEEDGQLAFHVGSPGGSLARITADDLAFVDEAHVLVLRSRPGGAELQEVDASAADLRVRWSLAVPDLEHPYRLVLGRAARTWVLHGTLEDSLVRLEGRVGAPSIDERRWRPRRDFYPLAVAAAGSDALVVEYVYEHDALASGGRWLSWPLLRLYLGTPGRVWWWRAQSDDAQVLGQSRLPAHCEGAIDREDRVVCSVFDGARTRFATLDPSSGYARPIGWVPGEFVPYSGDRERWIGGFVGSSALVLDLSARRGFRLSATPATPEPDGIAATDTVIAAVFHRRTATTVQLFHTPR